MIEKVVEKHLLKAAADARKRGLLRWLSLPPEARVSVVDDLRGQFYDHSARLQRTARIIQRPQC